MAVKPKFYETLYVVRPDIKEEELSKIQPKIEDLISSKEGEIYKSDKWAQRELAYEINDYTRGTYYMVVYKALPGVVADMEKHLRFYNNDVLRFMTVGITEDEANRAKSSPEEKSQEETASEEKAPETKVEQGGES